MACLQRLETARLGRPAREGFDYDEKLMAEMAARCVLAGIPRHLARLYELANEATRYRGNEATRYRGANRTPGWAPPPVLVHLDEASDMLGSTLTNDAAALLAHAVWHPWLTVFSRRRARKLQGLILRVFPSADYQKEVRSFTLSQWEEAQSAWKEWLAQPKRPGDGGDQSEQESPSG